MFVDSKDLVVFVYFDQSSDAFTFARLDTSDDQNFMVGLEDLESFNWVGNKMNHVIFTAKDEFRYVGTADTYGDQANPTSYT